jgi:predicted membrane channel-forming protein YqfA (hemolysin III family)
LLLECTDQIKMHFLLFGVLISTVGVLFYTKKNILLDTSEKTFSLD